MIVDNGKYFLYRHVRLDTNKPFYIGVGTKRAIVNSNRISSYGRAFSKANRTLYWHNITSKSEYEVDIVVESNNRRFIMKKEKEFVLMYGRNDLGEGTLVNVVDGGSKPTNKSIESIKRTINSKRAKGNLSNAKNFIAWHNSPNYKNPRSRPIYLYSSEGLFISEFNSVQECANYLGVKGSVSHLLLQCNRKHPYKNKFIFSWDNKGSNVDVKEYRIDKGYFKAVQKVCPVTNEVICEYEKMTDAANDIGVHLKVLSSAIRRESRKFGGFIWRKKIIQ